MRAFVLVLKKYFLKGTSDINKFISVKKENNEEAIVNNSLCEYEYF